MFPEKINATDFAVFLALKLSVGSGSLDVMWPEIEKKNNERALSLKENSSFIAIDIK